MQEVNVCFRIDIYFLNLMNIELGSFFVGLQCFIDIQFVVSVL